MIGALRFGHLPTIFVPVGLCHRASPTRKRPRCASATPKARRAARAAGIGNEVLSQPGTCTFYGTANTNQVVMEIMGLHLPGSSFVNPYTPLRVR